MVFTLKPHCPQVHQGTKTAYKIRVMFNKMMFWLEFEIWKDFFQHLSMILYLGLEILYGLLCKF